jgi:hypothetical protein
VIRYLIASLGSRANLALAHLTPKDVLTYRNAILKARKTARTANLSVKVVSAAVRQHIIESNWRGAILVAYYSGARISWPVILR